MIGQRTPKVSAIIIFLNEERFLAEAIESVLSQTYTDWELILVDDGSTDSSGDIGREASAQHPERVHYLTHPGQENRGMSASRNLGLSVASGDFVAFCDGDDVWLPHKLERQVAELETFVDAALTAGPLLRWLRWTEDPEALNHEDLMGVGPKRGRHPYSDQLVHPPRLVPLILSDDYYNPAGALIRKSALDEVGGFVNAFRGPHEDMVATTKICLRHAVYISPDISYLYRMHPNSYTQTASSYSDVIAARKIFLDWAEQYFEEHNITDPEVVKALRRAQRPLRHRRLHAILDPTRRRKSLVSLSQKIGRVVMPRSIRDQLRERWRDRVRPPEIEA